VSPFVLFFQVLVYSDAINIAEKIVAVIVQVDDSREWVTKEKQSPMWVIEQRGYVINTLTGK
jgi:hypothetical protein